jgi:5-(carboxyamino)imidazole ribonucleotide synthase
MEIPPGATIGILGSGQLGRMLTQAAHQLGYRVHIFSPEHGSPAGQVADLEIAAAYEDLEAVREFARQVDVVTYEFENVPTQTAETAAQLTPLHPGGWVLHTTQNRLREKKFLDQHNLPLIPFVAIHSLADLQAAVSWLGCPVVLKTATMAKGNTSLLTPIRFLLPMKPLVNVKVFWSYGSTLNGSFLWWPHGGKTAVLNILT